MTRRKGELSAARVDRAWPHQVALPVDRVTGEHYHVVHEFCRGLTLCSRGHTVRRDGVEYQVFCFSELGHANLFRAQFKGERFNPADRGRGPRWFEWRDRPER